MPKRKLRVLKRVPPIVGVCEVCLAQFKSVFTEPIAAQADIGALFALHKCAPAQCCAPKSHK